MNESVGDKILNPLHLSSNSDEEAGVLTTKKGEQTTAVMCTTVKRKSSTVATNNSPPRKQHAPPKTAVEDETVDHPHCETMKTVLDASHKNHPFNSNRSEETSSQPTSPSSKFDISLLSNTAPSDVKTTAADCNKSTSSVKSALEILQTYDSDSCSSMASSSMDSKETVIADTTKTSPACGSVAFAASNSLASKEGNGSGTHNVVIEEISQPTTSKESADASWPNKAASESSADDLQPRTTPSNSQSFDSDSSISIAANENGTVEDSNSGSFASMPSMESGTTDTTTAIANSDCQTSIFQSDISMAATKSETSVTKSTLNVTKLSTSVNAFDNSTPTTTTVVLQPSTCQDTSTAKPNTSTAQCFNESFESKTRKSIKCIEERQQFLASTINAMSSTEDCCLISAIKCAPLAMANEETIAAGGEPTSLGFCTNLNPLYAYIRRVKSFNASTEDLKAEEFIKTLMSEEEYAAFRYKKVISLCTKLDYVNLESFGKDECGPKPTCDACTQTNDSSKTLLHKIALLKESVEKKAEEIKSLKAAMKLLTPTDKVEEKIKQFIE